MNFLPYHGATVVLASGGYPQTYATGKTIFGLEKTRHSLVFHAGTRRRINGELETSGGRVLAVSAFARTLKEAITMANENARLIEFEGKYFRADIGHDVM
jgi:phosphoribosylamine--glycine ligase